MINIHRLKALNDKEPNTKGLYVVYWMQASQRILQNDALSYAIETANVMHKPLLVYFGITGAFPEANRRHYRALKFGSMHILKTYNTRKVPFSVVISF
ncbi:MAG: hypothetical protein WBI82_06745 [Sphaerochaeta sp.]